ncbi:Serine/threonine-protein kinase WNK [Hondaea fermentalgiana]|uniref:non-specific serine/threonine protein kinase n=1 Tax=Hondaea fermentalgiana TaxID=2315210 RepID=A0A2R5GUF4_9STRA|nr:Serine/threonine-protein kinase WNK [Hondaea fermentalgiana]|eukprot:GBG34492.1 Serine/threonine-protein kinase WNK [Hondaea fermentalgiana]
MRSSSMRAALARGLVLVVAALALDATHGEAACDEVAKPNVVIFYTDDQGYGDRQKYNPEILSMPNLEALADGGLEYTNGHSAAVVCTPSRFAILTGVYAFRERGGGGAIGASATPMVPGYATLASLLKSVGYRTYMSGKWHLGMDIPEDLEGEIYGGPADVGFDEFFGIPASMNYGSLAYIRNRSFTETPSVYTKKVTNKQLSCPPVIDERNFCKTYLLRFPYTTNGKTSVGSTFRADYCMSNITTEAMQMIETHVTTRPEQPFFIYIPVTAPHLPHVPHPDFAGTNNYGAYADFLEETDFRLGEIMQKLQDLGVYNDTLIIYSSDNGPEGPGKFRATGLESTSIFAGAKRTLWEGGHRVPFIMHWPNGIQAGTKWSEAVSQVDLFATFAEMTGAEIGAEDGRDSFSLWQTMCDIDSATNVREGQPLVIEGSRAQLAITCNDFKYNADQKRKIFDLGKSPAENIFHKKKKDWKSYGKKLQKLANDIKKDGHSDKTECPSLPTFNQGNEKRKAKSLRTLDLRSNQITLVPVDLSRLTKLKTLNLSHNKITSLPSGLEALAALQTLKLDANQLTTLPALPASIKQLTVSQNRLQEVPASVGNVTSLVELDMSENAITTVPAWLANLSRLLSVNLSHNRITTIEDGLGASMSLQTLLLASNRLHSIPVPVLEAAALGRLRVEGNQITKEQLMASPGWPKFDEKRKALVSKQIAGGMTDTDRSICATMSQDAAPSSNPQQEHQGVEDEKKSAATTVASIPSEAPSKEKDVATEEHSGLPPLSQQIGFHAPLDLTGPDGKPPSMAALAVAETAVQVAANNHYTTVNSPFDTDTEASAPALAGENAASAATHAESAKDAQAGPSAPESTSATREVVTRTTKQSNAENIGMGDDNDDDDDDEATTPSTAKRKNKIVDRSPTGRYVRFNDLLGEGAFKKVYRAYDTTQGVEVAWNQVKVSRMSPAARQRVMQEMKILQNLDHPSIIHFFSSFLKQEAEAVIFITEMMASGTLKEFIQNRPVLLRIVKRWCRHILNALTYLHKHDPPIIHRDLKCDNIFINGSTGDIRIGDLGLASHLRNGAAKTVLGTPEYMAPEMFEELYDEQVDIYAFGMCVLEMITKETPFMECQSAPQIYKKVIAGTTPACFDRVIDGPAKDFIFQCIKMRPAGERRPSAEELRKDPFLQKREADPEDDIDCQELLKPGTEPCMQRTDSTDSFTGTDGPIEMPMPPTQEFKQQAASTQEPRNGHHSVEQGTDTKIPVAEDAKASSQAGSLKLSSEFEHDIRRNAPLSPRSDHEVHEFSADSLRLNGGFALDDAASVGAASLPPPSTSPIPTSAASVHSQDTAPPSNSLIPPERSASAAGVAAAPPGKKVRVTLGRGTSVEARYGGESEWFPGKIQEINQDGTMAIKYMDQDYEARVTFAGAARTTGAVQQQQRKQIKTTAKFPYNIKADDPDSVTKELCQEMGIASGEHDTIAQKIASIVEDYKQYQQQQASGAASQTGARSEPFSVIVDQRGSPHANQHVPPVPSQSPGLGPSPVPTPPPSAPHAGSQQVGNYSDQRRAPTGTPQVQSDTTYTPGDGGGGPLSSLSMENQQNLAEFDRLLSEEMERFNEVRLAYQKKVDELNRMRELAGRQSQGVPPLPTLPTAPETSAAAVAAAAAARSGNEPDLNSVSPGTSETANGGASDSAPSPGTAVQGLPGLPPVTPLFLSPAPLSVAGLQHLADEIAEFDPDDDSEEAKQRRRFEAEERTRRKKQLGRQQMTEEALAAEKKLTDQITLGAEEATKTRSQTPLRDQVRRTEFAPSIPAGPGAVIPPTTAAINRTATTGFFPGVSLQNSASQASRPVSLNLQRNFSEPGFQPQHNMSLHSSSLVEQRNLSDTNLRQPFSSQFSQRPFQMPASAQPQGQPQQNQQQQNPQQQQQQNPQQQQQQQPQQNNQQQPQHQQK